MTDVVGFELGACVVFPHRFQAASAVGATFPLHCTANGKAFQQEMPVEQIKRLVPEVLQAFTSRTIIKREQLLEELKRVHLERVAYDREEHTEGICAVGTVVRDALGNPAVTIPVPSIRFYGNEQLLSSALLRTRERIAQRFDALMNFDNR